MPCRFAMSPLSPAGRRPRSSGSSSDAFDAQLLDEADDRVVFRHQLVHDAIYQHVPPPARRLLHREAAVALMAAGADRLDVADHLMLGAERGDEQAVAWLRDAAREASGQAPLGHRRAPPPRRGAAAGRSSRRGSGVVGGGPGAAACREGGRGVGPCGSGARPAARRRGGHPVARRAGRRAGPAEPCRRAHRRGRGQPRRPGPASARRSGADAGPAELGADVHRATPARANRPPAGRSPSPSRRAMRR